MLTEEYLLGDTFETPAINKDGIAIASGPALPQAATIQHTVISTEKPSGKPGLAESKTPKTAPTDERTIAPPITLEVDEPFDDDQVYRVGRDDVTPPSELRIVHPTYTEQARRERLQGKVILEVLMRKDGRTEVRNVVSGIGMGLDESAASAVRAWRFKPAMRKSRPVNVMVNIEVNFSLSGPSR